MALAYTAPTWTDGSGQGITAAQLQALCNCVEGLVQGTDKAIHGISISGSVLTITYADGSVGTISASGLKGIASIDKTSAAGLVDTYTITYTDGSTSTFTVTNGAPGEQGPAGPQGPDGPQGPAGSDGVSVTGVALQSTSGKQKTYRMSFSDGTHFDYVVADGADGQGSGDMLKSNYDSNNAVANAGGIAEYVANAISGKANTSDLDDWVGPQYSDASHKVTFSGLNANYGYMLTAENVDVGYKNATVSGSSITFEVEGDTVGVTPFYLRVLK